MVDVALILFTTLFAVLLMIGSVYFMVYFAHPDDKWIAWLPKVVVVLGMSLACYNVFLLPLDVANQRGQFEATGGIPMRDINLVFYFVTVCGCLTIVPFTIFYYEGVDDSDESDDKTTATSQFLYAIKWMIPTLVVCGGIIFVMYWQLGYAEIPVTVLKSPLRTTNDSVLDYCYAYDNTQCTYSRSTIDIGVSWIIYTIGLTTFIGWVLFSMFGGVGLIALPFDLFMEFKHRPKPIRLAEYTEKKKIVGEQATLLLRAGENLQTDLKEMHRTGQKGRFNSKARELSRRENEYKKDVLLLDEQYRRLEDAYHNRGGNVLIAYGKWVVAFIGTFVTLFWLLHICIYVIPLKLNTIPLTTFLNWFFTRVDSIPFIGVMFYGIFVFWLLLCVIKGNTKLGMRIFFITIHPMRIGETMMSSLVFNVGLILFSSLAVMQFATIAFDIYARYTAALTIFGVQIQNLKYIRYTYDAFVFILLAFSGLTMFYVVYRPYTKQREHRNIV